MFVRCLILIPDATNAVAPYRRSVNDKLHSISSPGRMILIPLLNNAMMTAELDKTHQTLDSIVSGEI